MKPPMGAAGAADENPLSGFRFGFHWYFNVNFYAPGIGASSAMKIHEFHAGIPDPVYPDDFVPVDREVNRHGGG
ncbi:MAG: hypothetical protein PHV57_02175, partial [Methanomicrobiaceae archaeon]|nr:hypothetical protein [Methanomicrobiaceae archaeon]